MDKFELLKSIGFSEEHVEHLKSLEDSADYIYESRIEEYRPITNDASNMVIDRAKNSFSTQLIIDLE